MNDAADERRTLLTGSLVVRKAYYPTVFVACFLTFAHRFFAALAIAALPAADKTRFFTTFISLLVESAKAFAAASKPLN